MYKKKLIYTIIPARSGSKSIKNKNIVKINKKPLIDFSIQTSLRSKYIDRTFVLTDSIKYKKIAETSGAEVPYIRSKKVSTDNTSDYTTINDFLKKLTVLKILLPDYLVHLRPTSPLRKVRIVDDAVKKFINAKDYTSLRSVHIMEESSYKTLEISDKTLVSSYTKNKNLDKLNEPRSKFPKTYFANGYVDIISVKYLLRNKKLHGNHVFPFISDDPCDIDGKLSLDYFKFRIKNAT